MESEPDAVLAGICPLYAMPAMGRKPEAVPGRHVNEVALTLDAKAGAALDQQDPLILGLVIPRPFRGSLALGEYPFEADSRA